MQISKTKSVQGEWIMEEKLTKLSRDLVDVRLSEAVLKEQLQEAQVENARLNDQLKQKDKQITTMAYMCMEEIQHIHP